MLLQLSVVTFMALPFTSTSCLIKPITIFSDFTSANDLEFFKQTLPWIVDNIGSDIKIKYYFKDSGKTSGPRQCVLSQLSRNTYLQATFLSCEANGKPRSECIKQLPLSNKALKTCMKLNVNGFVKAADKEFRRHKIKTTPEIALSRKIILSNEKPEDILKGICLLYPRKKPTGCLQPKPLPTEKPDGENMSIISSKAKTEKKIEPSTKQPITEKFEPSPEETTTNKVEPSTEQTTAKKNEDLAERTTVKKVESFTESPTTMKVEFSPEHSSTTEIDSSIEQTTITKDEFSNEQTPTKKVKSSAGQNVESSPENSSTTKIDPSTEQTTKVKDESSNEQTPTKIVESSPEKTTTSNVESSTEHTTPNK